MMFPLRRATGVEASRTFLNTDKVIIQIEGQLI